MVSKKEIAQIDERSIRRKEKEKGKRLKRAQKK